MRPPFHGGLYLVTDAASCGERGVVATVTAAVKGGARTVQLREKTASASEFLDIVMSAAAVVGDRAVLLVNDRVDVYLAARAAGAAVHGVHIGQSDLPPDAVRRLVGPGAMIGLSASTPCELTRAESLPTGTIDYVGVGSIHPTRTKPDHPAPLGVHGFRALVAGTSLACVAIGGITAADVAALRLAGAAGAAVVSAICGADDPEEAARVITAEWQG